jgi:hypothetical protein
VKSIPTGCSIRDVDRMLQPVGIDFTVCLFSTLGTDCVTRDVDMMLQPIPRVDKNTQ